MKTIAVINHKGGVGKTTTAINLAAALSRLGERSLIVDVDPQGNASTGVGITKDLHMLTSYEIFAGNFNAKIMQKVDDDLYIVPANATLSKAEMIQYHKSHASYLKKYLEKHKDSFDYVLIDCPPSINILALNALTAADSVIIPVQCEFLALDVLTQLLNSIRVIQKNFNPNLKIEGVLATMRDTRTNLSDEVVRDIRTYFKSLAFDTIIDRNVTLGEAPAFGKTVYQYNANCKGAMQYYALAKEMLENEQAKMK